MRTTKRVIVGVLLTIWLSGCMVVGRYFDASQTQHLRPGVTTKDEAVQMFGQPYSVSTYRDETQLLHWIYGPPYSSHKHLAVLFAKSGKMIRITQQTF